MDLSFWINEYTQNTNSKVRAGKFINFGTFTMPRGGTTPPSSGKWPIYWLQPWHLLLSQSIKHCRLASLDLSWAQQGSPARLSVGREPWNQSYWMRAEMELIPNLSTETLVLLAASLVLVYMWVAVQAPLLPITEFGVICRAVSFSC